MSEPREWISRISDDKLRERVRRVMVDLLVLSEAPASKPKLAPTDEVRKGAGKGGMSAKEAVKHHSSAMPQGLRLDQRSDDPPPRDRLYDWHAWHLERASDDELALLRLCYAAERDAKRARWGIKDYRKKDKETADREAESDENFERRIIAFYEGMDSMEVGMVYENRHAKVIEKARRKHGRDPENGLPLEGWFSWDEEQKVHEIRMLYQGGLGQKRIADELGVSKRAIQVRWPEVTGEVKAA